MSTAHENLCRHEAGHVVASIVLGVPVKHVQVLPHGHYNGYMRSGPRTVGEHAIITLAGMIEHPGPRALPEWPITSPQSGDEEQLAALIREHDISYDTYRSIEIAALRIASSKPYERLMTAVTGALDYWPVMDAGLVNRVVETVDQLEQLEVA